MYTSRLAGMVSISTIPIIKRTSPSPNAAPARKPRFRRSCWRSSGTRRHSTIKPSGRQTGPSPLSYRLVTRKSLTSIIHQLHLANRSLELYGQHADYVFGWQGDALQRAVDTTSGCDSRIGQAATCPILKTQAFTEANKCVLKNQINENVDGCEYSIGI